MISPQDSRAETEIKLMKNICRYVLPSYFAALCCALVGLALGMRGYGSGLVLPLAVLSLLPLLLFPINYIGAKCYAKKLRNTPVADRQAYLLRHRREAEASSAGMRKKLAAVRRFTTGYTVALALFAVCASQLGGLLCRTHILLFLLCMLYGGTLLLAVSERIGRRREIVLNDDTRVLPKEKYPALYAVVSRAAQALSCKKEITVILSADYDASITFDKRGYYLTLGVFLLQILSEEELYCVCLHEFSHVSDKNRAIAKEAEYAGALENSQPRTFLHNAAGYLFLLPDQRYLFLYNVFLYAESVVSESDADRDILKYGDARTAASALLKLSYYEKYSWERGAKDSEPLFAPEEPDEHCLSKMVSLFLDAVARRHEDWDAMVDKEIPANNASHPTLKMRLEAMGVGRAEVIEDQSSQAYRDETGQALAFAESIVFRNMKENYAEKRRKYYLEPLERVTEWERQGCPIIASQYADLISDLCDLGRSTEAEAVCDRAMKELDENSSIHAYFIKGCAMLSRYDAGGMELIYHAVETNHNYLDEGLDMIGTFCCKTGREQDLTEFRMRAQQQAQKHMDEDSGTEFLSPHDTLIRDEMPEKMLDDILTFIKSVDCGLIRKVYLVRKVISPTFFTSAFVLCFRGGTEEQQEEIYHKIFRYLDSYPADWQFSLFDYSDFPDIRFDRIKGSVVYENKDVDGG